MDITIEELIVWLVVGAFVGSVIGLLVKRKKAGFGHLGNLAVGLIGALIGGLLFKVFKIDLNLGADFVIEKRDLVAAVIGSVILLFAVWLIRRAMKGKGAKS